MRLIFLAFAATLLLIQPTRGDDSGSGADWPGWRGPERNGISRETGWTWKWGADGPQVRWRASVAALRFVAVVNTKGTA